MNSKLVLLLLTICFLITFLSACDIMVFKKTEVVLTRIVVIPRGAIPPGTADIPDTPEPIVLESEATIESTASETSSVVESSAKNSKPTEAPTKRVTPNSSPTASGCPGAPPQQVSIADEAYVCTKADHVVLREKPNRGGEMLRYLAPGTTMTIIGGPSCANDWSWWRVRTEKDVVGWVAEGGDHVDPYFICPK